MLARRIVDLTRNRTSPLVVAIDGRSGAGKSTLAESLATEIVNTIVIDGDDFYAGGTARFWDRLSAAKKVDHCIDWRRQFAVLDVLRSAQAATWYPYDWDADDGRLAPVACSATPAAVVILEGAYSARPELADVVDVRVLLDTPLEVCRQRVRRREGADYEAAWAARWDEAEEWYFSYVMPPDAFDVVLQC